MKIISGGQTGVDRAALDAALELGIECGGFCPKGRKSEDGIIPEKYPLTETATDRYPERTELNVKTSDATLVLINKESDRGTALTISLCEHHHKPCIIIDLSNENREQDLLQWIKENGIDVLNVAGNRESFSPGIRKRAYEFLVSRLPKANYRQEN
ncbi:MAG TPA: putative molybdenum carrier protein [Chitinophagaceae bacterium]|jgi:predicted Rossmann fold nucleotide-binding protein DprA/Smf involved in DNA uptake